MDNLNIILLVELEATVVSPNMVLLMLKNLQNLLKPRFMKFPHILIISQITTNSNGEILPARLWTSTMRRTIETAQFISSPTLSVMGIDDPTEQHEWVQMRPKQWAHLDEIFAGVCDGMTYEEIEESMPGEFELRKKDKLAYRYPRGESYLDVIARIEPIIVEMERHREPVLIIGHQVFRRGNFTSYF
jgi:broad specificity phosphatase PhoE